MVHTIIFFEVSVLLIKCTSKNVIFVKIYKSTRVYIILYRCKIFINFTFSKSKLYII